MSVSKHTLLILIDKRNEAAINVQKTLTAWGCLIRTRLGIHDGVLADCSPHGLIFCELVGDADKRDEMTRKLNLIKGVVAKQVELSLADE
jgi:hypothetical protein